MAWAGVEPYRGRFLDGRTWTCAKGVFSELVAEHALLVARAWLVNVGRGGLVLTDVLLRSLRDGWIAGAAPDVTKPEPLPDGHPLFTLDSCLVTPHVAGTLAATMEPFAGPGARERAPLRRLGCRSSV